MSCPVRLSARCVFPQVQPTCFCFYRSPSACWNAFRDASAYGQRTLTRRLIIWHLAFYEYVSISYLKIPRRIYSLLSLQVFHTEPSILYRLFFHSCFNLTTNIDPSWRKPRYLYCYCQNYSQYDSIVLVIFVWIKFSTIFLFGCQLYSSSDFATILICFYYIGHRCGRLSSIVEPFCRGEFQSLPFYEKRVVDGDHSRNDAAISRSNCNLWGISATTPVKVTNRIAKFKLLLDFEKMFSMNEGRRWCAQFCPFAPRCEAK